MSDTRVAKKQKEVFSPDVIAMHEKSEKHIDATIKKVEKGYLTIVSDVAMIQHYATYGIDGHKNIISYLKDRFGMGKSTAYNLIGIAERFCGEDFNLLPEYADLSMTTLLSVMPLSKDDEKLLPDNWRDMPYRELGDLVKTLTQEEKTIEEKSTESKSSKHGKQETGESNTESSEERKVNFETTFAMGFPPDATAEQFVDMLMDGLTKFFAKKLDAIRENGEGTVYVTANFIGYGDEYEEVN